MARALGVPMVEASLPDKAAYLIKLRGEQFKQKKEM